MYDTESSRVDMSENNRSLLKLVSMTRGVQATIIFVID